MKKIIGGKRYNTDTATLVGEYVYGSLGGFNRIHEGLYRTKNGSYFVAGVGNPRTRYAVSVSQNCWGGSEDIYPLSPAEALEWAQAYLEEHEIEKEFGSQIEDA